MAALNTIHLRLFVYDTLDTFKDFLDVKVLEDIQMVAIEGRFNCATKASLHRSYLYNTMS